MIAVDGLTRRFGAVVALDNVKFPAADGAITGILGPNGAGKTTLMRILATLILPDAGSARVDDYDCVGEPMAVRQRFGILSDAKGLYPRLTARENVAYFGALHGLRRAAIRERTDILFERLDMRAATIFWLWTRCCPQRFHVGGAHNACPLTMLNLLKCKNGLSCRGICLAVDFSDPVAELR